MLVAHKKPGRQKNKYVDEDGNECSFAQFTSPEFRLKEFACPTLNHSRILLVSLMIVTIVISVTKEIEICFRFDSDMDVLESYSTI
jgi:hypothetical protein